MIAIFQDITNRKSLETKMSQFAKNLCKIDSIVLYKMIFSSSAEYYIQILIDLYL